MQLPQTMLPLLSVSLCHMPVGTSCRVGKNHDFFKIKKSDFFLFKSDFFIFFQKNRIFTIFSLYCTVKHQYIAKIAENLSSIVSCTLHRIKVPKLVTVKSVVKELNKLNTRTKQYICFCLL